MYKTGSYHRFLEYQREKVEELHSAIDTCQEWVMNFEVEKGNIDSVFSAQQLDRKILEEAAEDLKHPDERRNRME